MEKFLTELYSYENFGLYLIIAIVVLVILFVVILFFGKKDKKERELEETKRLQKLNPELFKKEENEEPIVEETSVLEPGVKEIEEQPVIEPITNQSVERVEEEITPIVKEETVIPEINNVDVELPKVEVETPILEKAEEKPILVEEEKEDVVLQNIPEFNFEEVTAKANEILQEEPIIENVKEPIIEQASNNDSLLEMPETVEEKKENVPVFSSVYVPKNEEVEEDLGFDLPQLKSEVQKSEEPAVEKEEVQEPELIDVNEEIEPFNNVDIDNIMGESYTINK